MTKLLLVPRSAHHVGFDVVALQVFSAGQRLDAIGLNGSYGTRKTSKVRADARQLDWIRRSTAFRHDRFCAPTGRGARLADESRHAHQKIVLCLEALRLWRCLSAMAASGRARTPPRQAVRTARGFVVDKLDTRRVRCAGSATGAQHLLGAIAVRLSTSCRKRRFGLCDLSSPSS